MNHIPTVKTCCCCLNLELASTVIGITESLSCVIALSHDIYLLSADPTILDGSRILKSGLASDTFISAIQMALGVGLILAVRERYARYVRFWIMVHILLYVVSIVNYILASVLIPCCGRIHNVSLFERLMALYSFRNFILYGYCIIVVNSYYGQLLKGFTEDDERAQ